MGSIAPKETVIVGSRALAKVMELARRVAKSPCTILITGESGTGKEIIAKTIHESSPNCNNVFVPLNVSAIPESLIESYLFGHERGAFTGAESKRDGIFRSAGEGTVFLDEIGELPLSAQPKLLRTLEQKEIMPVGSDRPIQSKARVVAATVQDIKAMVKDGRFREDLFFRLNVINIHIPPLRERPEDIPLLVDYYLNKSCTEFGLDKMQISPEAKRRLIGHAWKGNVRELRHTLERAVLLCDSSELRVADLPADFLGETEQSSQNLGDAVSSFKRRHILSVLESVDCRREAAARALGISNATLYRYLDSLDLHGYGTRGHMQSVCHL